MIDTNRNGMKSTVTKEIVFRNKLTKEVTMTIPVGTKITIKFQNDNSLTAVMEIDNNNIQKKVRMSTLISKCSGFTKIPSIATLTRWSNDGVAKSITGKKVEPDGYGDDGSPSWLLVMGVI